jgi:hypothetical protein
MNDLEEWYGRCGTQSRTCRPLKSPPMQTVVTHCTKVGTGSQQLGSVGAKTSSLNSNELALVRMGSGLRFVRVL